MLTIVAILLALTVIPSPWGWVAVIVAGLIDVAETTFFVRWSKRRRATVGAETLVGRTAVVVRALTPRGQVKLDGEVWEARGPARPRAGRRGRRPGRRARPRRRAGQLAVAETARGDAAADARVRRDGLQGLGAPAGRADGGGRPSRGARRRPPALGRSRRRRAHRRRRARDRAGREPRGERRRATGGPARGGAERRAARRRRGRRRRGGAGGVPRAILSATGRGYRYVVLDRRERSPLRARRALWWPRPLDDEALHASAALLVGEHDFTAFTPTETQHEVFRGRDPRMPPGSVAATSSTSRSPPTRSSATWCGRSSGRCSSRARSRIATLLDGPAALRGGRHSAAVGAVPRARRLREPGSRPEAAVTVRRRSRPKAGLPAGRSEVFCARRGGAVGNHGFPHAGLRSVACAFESSSSTSTAR